MLIYEGQSRIYTEKNAAGQMVLVKEPVEELLTPRKIEMLENEYEICRTLDIQGVRKALGVETVNGHPVMRLEYIEGSNLRKWLETHRPDLASALRVSIKIAHILEEVHRAGITHKDLNSRNILIEDNTRRVWIIDFGLATRMMHERPEFSNFRGLEGSLEYISPEQTGRMNRSVDHRCDLYSLGVVMYELFTGRLPFRSDDPLELVHSHIARIPTTARETNPDIPEMPSRIISRLLCKNAEDRYQSAFGLSADLQRCLEPLRTKGRITAFTPGKEDVSGRFRIPQKLYGREQELEILHSAFDRTNTSGQPSLLLVTGDAGIGKSALVHEVHKPMIETHGYFLEGKFEQFQRDIPYSGWIRALKGLINHCLMESDSQLTAWKDAISTAVGNNGKILTDLIPNLELIIGPQPELPEAGGQEARNRFNHVFRNFIKAVAYRLHPLVIFLDDLQWIDSASSRVITILLTDPMMTSLLIIGAYRENEVNAAHPLMMEIERLKQQQVRMDSAAVGDLTEHDITALIADAFRNPFAECMPLARLIYSKTGGNAFFTHRLLLSLHEEGRLFFDETTRRWQWEMASLETVSITENIAELMIDNILKLPANTREVLRQAACIGSRFDLESLCLISKIPKKDIRGELHACMHEGLIFSLHHEQYTFAHDRIQHAIYTSIPGDERKAIHLRIGKSLLHHIPRAEQEDRLFEIVNQLNSGREQPGTPQENTRLIELNLAAGKKAKASNAYEAAARYLRAGRTLSGEDAWETRHDLTFELYTTSAECAYLLGRFTQSGQLLDSAFEHCKTHLEEARISIIALIQKAMQAEYAEAVSQGIETLKRFDLHLPAPDSKDEIERFLRKESAWCHHHWAGKAIAELGNLPVNTDPLPNTAMIILSTMLDCAGIGVPDYLGVLTMTMVNESIKHGNTNVSACGYVFHGMFLVGRQEYEEAYQFGDLALTLNEQTIRNTAVSSKLFTISSTVSCYHDSYKIQQDRCRRGYQAGVESGDFTYASYNLVNGLRAPLSFGLPLSDFLAESHNTLLLMKKLNYLSMYHLIQVFNGYANNLAGGAESPDTFDHEDFKEHTYRETYARVSAMTALLDFYKLKAYYLLEKYAQALSILEDIDLAAIEIQPESKEFRLYAALILLKVYSEADESAKKQYEKQIESYHTLITKLADICPLNFRAQDLMLAAERALVARRDVEAIDLYDKAIASAQKSEFIHEEALAHELAAKFWHDRGRETIAKAYMLDALRCYRRWGAKAKIDDLKTRHPKLCSFYMHREKTSHAGAPTSIESRYDSGVALDLASVLKASQAIAGELELKKLLKKMLHIVIENAGARTGCLILEQDGEWKLEARGNIDEPDVPLARPLRISDGDAAPAGIIRYVARTREQVVLENAIREGDFTRDPYIRKNRTKSALCIPLLNQGRVSGIIYLENNLTTGAFTQNRLALLQLLSSRVAVSIDNARLYQQARREIEERKKAEEELEKHRDRLESLVIERTSELRKAKEVAEEAQREAESANCAKSDFLANMSHELRTPLNAVLGFSEILRHGEKDEKKSHFLESIQTSGEVLLSLINDVLDLSKIEAGKLDLHYSAVSLPAFARETELIFIQQAREKGLELVVLLDPDLPRTLLLDETRVRQVCINLMGNAVKFTETGVVRLEIGGDFPHDSKGSTGSLRMIIEDTGKGIPGDKIDAIFDAFHQIRGQKGAPHHGTGLGLAITRRLVEMMDGEIVVKSEEGRGTAFTIVLPEVEVVAGEVVKEQPEKPISMEKPRFEPATILIAEDIEYNREILTIFLEDRGFEFIHAENGREAIDRAREHTPDLILLDMKMPVMDGYEASARLKADEQLKNIPVVAVTAIALLQNVEKISHFCDGYLSKPVKKSALVRELMRFLPHTIVESPPARERPNHLASEEEAPARLKKPPPEEALAEIIRLTRAGLFGRLKITLEELTATDPAYTPFCRDMTFFARKYNAEGILRYVKKLQTS